MTTRKNNSSRSKSNGNIRQIVNQQVQRALLRGEEHKFFNSNVQQFAGSTPAFYALTQDIIQGIGGGQRVGDDIRVRRISMRYAVVLGAGATFSNYLRVVLFMDKQNNGTIPAYTDLLVSGSPTAGYSQQQVKEKRFHILYDKVLGNSISGDVNIGLKEFQMNNEVHFNATTSVTAANGKNSLWLMIFSSDNTHPPGFNSDFEVMFTDA